MTTLPPAATPAEADDTRHRVADWGRFTVATGPSDERGVRGEQSAGSWWVELHAFGRYVGVYR